AAKGTAGRMRLSAGALAKPPCDPLRSSRCSNLIRLGVCAGAIPLYSRRTGSDTPATASGDIMEGLGKPLPTGTPTLVAFARHPLHPMLVTFPIAFLLGALGSD